MTYSWVQTSGSGYTIVSGNSANLIITTGQGPATFELTVTNPNGCSSTCSVDVMAACGRYCSYTQGAYGNGNGMRCDGTRSHTFIGTLLSSGPLTIGVTNAAQTTNGQANYITFTQADSACVLARLPGGGVSAQLNGAATCSNPTGIALNSQGRFRNVLLAQTITLGFNIRVNGGAMAGLPVTGAYMTTYASTGTGCSSIGTPVSGTARTTYIPQVVLDYLNANTAIYPGGATVGNIFMLASDVLGRRILPGTVPSLSALNGACTAFNEGFDECRQLGGFSATAPASSRGLVAAQGSNLDNLKADGVFANAYPNPFSTSTTIEFALADYNAHVAVEVFSLSGEKVADLFQGEVNGGVVKRVEFNAQGLSNGIYVYRITTSDRVFYNKMLLNK